MATITVDDSKRVLLPDVKPRQVLDYSKNPDGSILLTPVVKAEPETVMIGLVLRDGELVMDIPEGWTLDETSIV